MVGRFTHEPGSVGRSSELRLSTQKSVLEGSGLLQWRHQGSGFLGLNRLQIGSTDRCEYSAISVDVFTIIFHGYIDLRTLIETNKPYLRVG